MFFAEILRMYALVFDTDTDRSSSNFERHGPGATVTVAVQLHGNTTTLIFFGFETVSC